MAEITDIRAAGRASRSRLVSLDGYGWRPVPQEVVAALGLRVGQTVDVAALTARIDDAEPPQAWRRVLLLLGYRDRGSQELRERLLDDGYSAAVIETALARAVGLGLVDDHRFAEGLARRAADKGRGRRRIAAELDAKGVDAALAAEILTERFEPDAERERAVALARRLVRREGLGTRALAARLCRAGFETPLALAVAEEVSGAADDPPDVG